jgi:hypothetical protein
VEDKPFQEDNYFQNALSLLLDVTPTLPSAPTRPASVACGQREEDLVNITPTL